MGCWCWCWALALQALCTVALPQKAQAQAQEASNAIGIGVGETCNFFKGSWVVDSYYPLYNSSSCPFIESEFSCLRNGRPDLAFAMYRWQPLTCPLARFNGEKLLEKVRGKSIMFVGDSISRNQWKSLTCMLHSSLPNAKYTVTTAHQDLTIFTFLDYRVNVMLNRNVYLVDVVQEPIGRVLKLDSILGGKLWIGIDYLVFNTWHWWNRRGSSQPWDYIQIGNQTYKDMDRTTAFQRGLETWAAWVDANIDPAKTKVFFQGISPSHYNGTEWGQPGATCTGQQQPVPGMTYTGGTPPAVAVLKGVLGTIKKPVTLLDITELSQLRKDGHPSMYGLEGRTSDCSHWCLAGVPDAWNEILYNLIV